MTESKTPSGNKPSDFVNALWAAETVEEVNQYFTDANTSSIDGQSLTKVAIAYFSRLKRLTFENAELAHPIISTELFEWCVKPSGDDEVVSNMQAHSLRGLLNDWTYQYSFEKYSKIRREILQKVLATIKTKPTQEILWVAATIGYRTIELGESLEEIWQDEGHPLSDNALGVYIGLGVSPEKFDDVLDEISRRLGKKRLSRGCFIGVQELPGPRRPELAFEILNTACDLHGDDERHIDFSLAFSVTSKVADRVPENFDLHGRIWNVFREYYDTVSMTPDFASSCNLKQTTLDHIDWLLNPESSNDPTTRAYITLSRMSELILPHQLDAWEGTSNKDLEIELEKYATLDTRIEGRYTTTSLRVKRQSWETALVANFTSTQDWIDKAILDETNSNAANDICKIAACTSPESLSERFLDAIKTPPPSEEGNQEWTRHLGMIEVACACGSAESYEALLNFGLTRDGNVLLSTVRAITDCALNRIREEDVDTIANLLAKTTSENQTHHQQAAITAFCNLVSSNVVDQTNCDRLWEFAFNEKLDEYSRCHALESISLSQQMVQPSNLQKLLELAAEEGEVGWRSCEVSVKRKLLEPLKEKWLLEKLGLELNNERIDLDSPEQVDGWQAFLVGQLYQQKPATYCDAVSAVIGHGPTQSLYQIIGSIEAIGWEPTDQAATSLVERIKTSNSSTSTNTELFRVLRNVSEKKLLTLVKALNWRGWMVAARAALCEMVGQVAIASSDLRYEAVICLLEFMRDALFQVRRPAYRAMAYADSGKLRTQCEIWSKTGDVEYRKRGAEAVTWLPRETYSDEYVDEFGFGWDEEPSVRDVFKGTIQRRYRLQLGRDYLQTVLNDCKNSNGTITTYRFAKALETVGDDETTDRIQNFFDENRFELRPHVVRYLEKTQKAVRKNWKKITEKWPGPWSHEVGVVERAVGKLLIKGKDPVDAEFTLRCHYKKGPSKLGDWSAIAVVTQGHAFMGFNLTDDPVEIQIENRENTPAYVFGLGWRDNSTKAVLTLGGGLADYPVEKQTAAEEHQDLHNTIRGILEYADVRLAKNAPIEIGMEIARLVESTELDFIELGIGNVSEKQICQVAAKVLSKVVNFFANDSRTSIVLWGVANAILDRSSLTLRLNPLEAEALQSIARKSEPGSPDRLLFWLLERIGDQPEVKPKHIS